MEENSSLWQDLEFSWNLSYPKMTSHKQVINMKNVENFKPYDLESNIVPIGVGMLQLCLYS
jgi:hypothetical protein